MKKAVVTIACGDLHWRLAAITRPTLEAYARRLGADWIAWNDVQGHSLPHYQKLELGKLLDDYDRVLYVDNDIIIREDAPDIFELVPEGRLGVLEETQYVDRTLEVAQFIINIKFPADDWDRKYYNTGVMVLSKHHKNLFAQPAVEWNHYGEQTYLNLMIAATKTKVFALPHRFNRLFVADPAHGEERVDSYFLHYAGVFRNQGDIDQLRMVESDLAIWEQARPGYRFPKKIAFSVDGDLAEQICAEPAIRFAQEVIFPNEQIAIVSDWPEVFRHLNLPVYGSLAAIPGGDKFHVRHTLGNPKDTSCPRRTRSLFSDINWTSWHALGVELPLAAKSPHLSVDPRAVATLAEKLGSVDMTNLVVVHAGKGCPSVTLPAAQWQAYVDLLTEVGYRVAAIGGAGTRGLDAIALDLSRSLNLTDTLSFAEIVALVSQAPAIVSNDSAAIQIAGAFQNWIGLVTTVRRPDLVLPYRQNSPFWQSKSLERTPMYDDYLRHSIVNEQSDMVDCNRERMMECLAEPATVLEFVRNALARQGQAGGEADADGDCEPDR